MATEPEKRFFCALPGRMLGDKRLNGSDWKVLAVISSRDRMGRNGQGCWEEPKRMAARLGMEIKSFHRSVSKLIKLEYLEAKPRENDARKKIYKIIFINEFDAKGIDATQAKSEKSKATPKRDQLHRRNQTEDQEKSKYPIKSEEYDQSQPNRIYSDNRNISEKNLSTKKSEN